MNRVELIAKLAGRKGFGAASKSRGMAHPGEVAPARIHVRPASKGYFTSPAFQAVRDVRLRGYLNRAPADDLMEGACFKVAERHEAHHLTRIAEKLRRR